MDDMSQQGRSVLGDIFLAHRTRLIQFINARGAGSKAEVILQHVWETVVRARPAMTAVDSAFLYRTTNALITKEFRANRSPEQGLHRGASERLIFETLALLPPRVTKAFRHQRLDEAGIGDIAREMGATGCEIENDLRQAYLALAKATPRGRQDQPDPTLSRTGNSV